MQEHDVGAVPICLISNSSPSQTLCVRGESTGVLLARIKSPGDEADCEGLIPLGAPPPPPSPAQLQDCAFDFRPRLPGTVSWLYRNLHCWPPSRLAVPLPTHTHQLSRFLV